MSAVTWFWLVMALVAGLLLWLLGPVLTPFLAGALLAYLGDPLVDRLERLGRGRWRLGRAGAVALLFVLLTIALALALLLLVPMLVATEFAQRNSQRHQMHIESALSVLPRIAKFEQIKNGLNIGVKSIVALAGKCRVTIGESENRLPRVFIQLSRSGHAFAGRVFTVVAFVIKRRGVALIVRWNDARSDPGGRPAAAAGLLHGDATWA